ncbi:2',3'-cyclic-nucleotide 3'-phosphodiesterase [Teratosphaeria destructans]|uniref:2',3'-cyclic-nucleotide 3'-phosphodiesterase n=1 Tax=Teratosphaeria destructans TaxID=418781 RepID=A0A9W7SUG6_9PEZI|nr:2',3'-cyclic-nucleotide 3'-phosphodiesterase [Teratosphaeria destructans]
MPGFSLWLVPHKTTPFAQTTQDLISDTIPRHLLPADQPPLTFPPHITLHPDIPADLLHPDPQTWLSGLPLPPFQNERDEVVLELDALQAEDPFFRKLNIAVSSDANLRRLAAAVRRRVVGGEDADAEDWAERVYRPHLSLFYGATETGEVRAKMPWVEMKIGFAWGDLFACCGGALGFGGEMVLVDTSRAVGEWEGAVVGRRETEWVCWRASRNLN